MTEITYALFGDYNVGKTAFVVRHQTGEFIKHRFSVDNISIRLLDFHTSEGKINLAVTENHINEDCQGIMVMFDVTNRDSFKYSTQVIEKLNRMCPNTPIVWIGNKVDIIMRNIMNRDIEERIITKGFKIVKYVEISVASMYNLNVPFIELLRTEYPDISTSDIEMESSVSTMTSMEDSDDIGDKENIFMMSDNE